MLIYSGTLSIFYFDLVLVHLSNLGLSSLTSGLLPLMVVLSRLLGLPLNGWKPALLCLKPLTNIVVVVIISCTRRLIEVE